MKNFYGNMTRKEQKRKIALAISLLKDVEKNSWFYGSNLKEVIACAERNIKEFKPKN